MSRRTGLGVVIATIGFWAMLWGVSPAQEPAAVVRPILEPPSGAIADEVGGGAGAAGEIDEVGGQAGGVGRRSLVDLIRQANPMLWPLVICSVVTLGFTFERLFSLRKGRVMPRDFSERFLDRLVSGKIDRERASELCRANDCVLARVFGRVVSHWGAPTTTLQDVADREISGEIQEFKRNVRILNGTATLAPLLGLLGTVVGLIEAFDSLSVGTSGGVGKNEALAHGISLALLATAFGLAVAIVSVIFYYVLQHRIDSMGRSMELETNRLIDQIAGDSVNSSYAEARR